MNVLYISYDGALDPLGNSQIIPYLSGLSKKGIKFTLLTYEKKERSDDTSRLERIRGKLSQDNIKWEILRYHKSPALPATIFDITIGVIKGLTIVFRDRINLIHARSFVGAIPAILLAKFINLKIVFDMRGLWPEERVEGGLWRKDSLLYKIAKWWEKLLILNSDHLVCLTEEASSILQYPRYLNGRKIPTTVIPTFVDIIKFDPKKKIAGMRKKLGLEGKFILIYCGSLGTWYMIDEMVDFFSVGKLINKDFFFLILTPDKILAQERLTKKGISRQDYLVHFVSYDELPFWICEADLSISFIRPTFSKKSSCPTKLAESLACGIPVLINSGIGDTGKIVLKERVGIVINGFSDNEYKKAIDEYIYLCREKKTLADRCRFVAENRFSLDDGIAGYLKIYGELIKK